MLKKAWQFTHWFWYVSIVFLTIAIAGCICSRTWWVIWKVPRMDILLQFSKFPGHLPYALGQLSIWEGPLLPSQIGHLCQICGRFPKPRNYVFLQANKALHPHCQVSHSAAMSCHVMSPGSWGSAYSKIMEILWVMVWKTAGSRMFLLYLRKCISCD